jgi:cellulose synthase/poly-beta-1,6-N-acetylglucosamine synthase-like glycosyltransferase
MKAPVSPVSVEMPCEITVVMPTYNSIITLGHALRSVHYGKQSCPVKLMLIENGSEDGTQLLLRDLKASGVTRNFWMTSYSFADIAVVEVPQSDTYPGGQARKHFNLRECYQTALPDVDTEYVLFMDSDVEVPVGGVRTMLQALKEDSGIGWVGITYDPKPGHIQHGCAMMRTGLACELASGLKMDPPRYICHCAQFGKMVADRGLKSVPLDPLSARHLRLEA